MPDADTDAAARIVFNCFNVIIDQDVCIVFYHKSTKSKICAITFNTMFVKESHMTFQKIDIDKVIKSKIYK